MMSKVLIKKCPRFCDKFSNGGGFHPGFSSSFSQTSTNLLFYSRACVLVSGLRVIRRRFHLSPFSSDSASLSANFESKVLSADSLFVNSPKK
jgi:hypothetical protein